MIKSVFMLLLVALFGAGVVLSEARAEAAEYHLVIKNHMFDPAEIEVPANTKIVLVVKNEDTTAEEFESHDFRREKIIPGGGTAKIKVGPLAAGEYKFFGEFNEKTAQGKLVVK